MMNKEMETEHYDFISPYYGAAYFMEDKSMDQATHGKVAIFLHIFYEDLAK